MEKKKCEIGSFGPQNVWICDCASIQWPHQRTSHTCFKTIFTRTWYMCERVHSQFAKIFFLTTFSPKIKKSIQNVMTLLCKSYMPACIILKPPALSLLKQEWKATITFLYTHIVRRNYFCAKIEKENDLLLRKSAKSQ